MSLERLKVLEGTVEDMLGQHTALCEERDQLHQELGKAQKRIDAMSRRLADSEKERAEIKARVESILSRLEALNLA